ncbi:mitogen-activated protein kinase kinase kinase 19 isoform X2 [Melanotaenia boesemani]|uniref:mitogen-activated protein kinase kinase kinase 19 isoform X2 n=1 Tax=Melanotaenia boesemani TaxID=1250792 RepID=UPI001C04513B|nr:mitogen-activated protein kinase kinase kinase 19 isoform X2 [Melanotaenia boesemani]
METLKDRRSNQEVKRGSSTGLSLPSLCNNSRHWGREDPALSSGSLSTRTTCQPAPPRERQRTRSVVDTSSPSHGLMSVAQSSQLSQSAPSIMEPLLSPNTMMQARAHVQTRLGSQKAAAEQKGPLPALNSRTPKLLAPLDSRPRDSTALPVLKQRVPLKPISQSSLWTRTQLRRERLSWGSPSNSPPTSKAGSEESGSSSSSQSSTDLEEADDHKDDHDSTHGDRNQMFSGDGSLQNSKYVKPSAVDLAGQTSLHFKVQPRTSQIPLVHRSKHHKEGDIIYHKHHQSNEKPKSSHCEANIMSYTKGSVESESSKGNNKTPVMSVIVSGINNKVNFTTDPETGITYDLNDVQDDAATCSEICHRNKQQHAKQTETTRNTLCTAETKVDKLTGQAAVGKPDFFAVDPKQYENTFKTFKPVQNKERRTMPKADPITKIQINQSFNVPSHKDQNICNKPKSNLKYSVFSTQAKDKMRKSPELHFSRQGAVTKIKFKMKSVSAAPFNNTTPTPRKKVCDLPQSKGAPHPDKLSSNRTQHTAARELKSAQHWKKPFSGGKTPRSKSAVDLITYKDMFQQIQSGDEGPAIYEMFAGPIFENLRVSSSCETLKEVEGTPPWKPQQGHKIRRRPLRPAQNNLKRNSGESEVISAKSKAKPVPSRIKPTPNTLPRGDICTTDSPKLETEIVFPKDANHNYKSTQDEKKEQILSTPEEDNSSYGSQTLKSDDKPLQEPTSSSDSEGCNHPNQRETTESVLLPNPLQPQINMQTSSSSSSHTSMSPVYQKFLDELGDGPLTEDLLQCLAEELISLDERDVSEDHEQSIKESSSENEPTPRENFSEDLPIDSGALIGSGLVVDGTITWTKGEILGRGAYGTVYCGLTSQGQLIAVKQVSLDSSDPHAAKKEYNRLQEEVELLKTLRHINIVGFLGTLLCQHVVSIFMEYIPGGSIASILHRFGPLPERVLTLYTHQILEGVAFLHLNRVIHRDLKGNNVMLMPTGVIKLIDFGCARRLSCLNHTASNSGELLKSVHGTPYWMAPEVINESGYGRKSDIWSVGCTVFEMATGKPPLAHMDKMAALFYIGAQKGLMPSLPEGFSENAKDFVKICLTSDQRLRPSADQLLKHSFISRNEKTNVKTWRRERCGRQMGRSKV